MNQREATCGSEGTGGYDCPAATHILGCYRSKAELDDGFGSIWIKCADKRCDLEIVRPGKAQCSDYCDEAGWPDEQETA